MTMLRVLNLFCGAAVLLAVTSCGATPTPSAPGGAAPSALGQIQWHCIIGYVPGDELQSDAATYGVISLTITNNTSQPVHPYDYQVYVFGPSPGLQDGTASVPQQSKGDVAPDASETFTGGDLWPLGATCRLASRF